MKLVAVTLGLAAAVLATQAFAQPDTQKAAPVPNSAISAHRMAALKKCTDRIKFESDKYVACMTQQGENP